MSGGLPFLVDLALGLSVLACSMLRILYNGPEITKEEETCQELLRSKLLQRSQRLQIRLVLLTKERGLYVKNFF